MPGSQASGKPSVFLVHGRDHDARDAVARILKAYGTDVWDWTIARQRTRKPSPTTLDVIRKSISDATAVAVLLTPDETVRLDVANGDEDQTFRRQARPNVLFEAGWAMAKKSDKTVFIRLGPVDMLSDIDGINYVSLDDTVETREDLRLRLIDAGCRLLDTDKDWRTTRASGALEPILQSLASAPVLPDPLPRSDNFVPYVVDSALSLRLDRFQLMKDVKDAVAGGKSVDLKYHYVGQRLAGYWQAVCQEQGYGHDGLVEAEQAAMTELVAAANLTETSLGLISLGPGDGTPDSQIAQSLQQAGCRFRAYYPVDISDDLLRITINQFKKTIDSGALDHMPMKAIQADFEDTLQIFDPVFNPYSEDEGDDQRNLMLMTGFTLGNSQEGDLISSITGALYENDVLFLDARLHTFGRVVATNALSEAQKVELAAAYSSGPIAQFAFGPVEEATDFAIRYSDLENAKRRGKRKILTQVGSKLPGTKLPQVAADVAANIGVEVTTEIVVQGTSSVPHAVNVYLNCLGLLEHDGVRSALGLPKPRRKERSHIRLATVTYYDYDALLEWFDNQGLSCIWSRVVGEIGLFALVAKGV